MAHNNAETGDGGGQQERQTELVLHSGQDRIGTKSTKLNTFKNKAFIIQIAHLYIKCAILAHLYIKCAKIAHFYINALF